MASFPCVAEPTQFEKVVVHMQLQWPHANLTGLLCHSHLIACLRGSTPDITHRHDPLHTMLRYTP